MFNLLLISTFSLRFIFPLLSLEGKSFWKIKSAPVDYKSYLIKKIVPMGLIIFMTGQALSFFINLKFGLAMIVISALVTGLSTAAIIAINFGLGGLFSNYKEKNPIRLSSSKGASISFLMNIFYMLFIVVLLFSPLANLFNSLRLNHAYKFDGLFATLLPIGIISVIIIAAFLKSGFDSLKKDF